MMLSKTNDIDAEQMLWQFEAQKRERALSDSGRDARAKYMRAMRDDTLVRHFYDSWVSGELDSFEDMLMASVVAQTRYIQNLERTIRRYQEAFPPTDVARP